MQWRSTLRKSSPLPKRDYPPTIKESPTNPDLRYRETPSMDAPSPRPTKESKVPYFTVVLTTHNRASLLEKAIQSVLAQSFSDYELIIVNDASPDNTDQVVAEYIAPNVRYLRQPTNLGIGAARNLGIEHTNGTLIVFLDDDDCLGPDFLAHVYEAFRSAPPSVGFALPSQHITRLGKDGTVETVIRDYEATTVSIRPKHEVLAKPRGGASGMIVRASAARQIGGFLTERPFIEDTDFILRMAASFDLMIIPQAMILINYLPLPRLTTDWLTRARGCERLADRHRTTSWSQHPTVGVHYYIKAARLFYSGRERADGRRCLWKALCLAPLAPRTWKFVILLEASDFFPVQMRRRAYGIR